MTSNISNDNSDAVHGPDAHGQAAILLVESLLHGLVEAKVLSLEAAVEIVETAVEVNSDVAGDLGHSPANLRRSLSILDSIGKSLSRDIEKY